MKNKIKSEIDLSKIKTAPANAANRGSSRRRFLSQVGAALAGGAVFGKAALASAQSYNPAIGDGIAPLASTDPRVQQSYKIRKAAATAERHIPVPPHTTNGDEQLYPDKSGTYSKGILQDGIGVVNHGRVRDFQKRDQHRNFRSVRECYHRRTANDEWPAGRSRLRPGGKR